MIRSGHLQFILIFVLTFIDSCNGTRSVRHRHRKQAVDGSSRFDYDPFARVTLFPNVNVNVNGNQGTPVPNAPPPIPWPGSDNAYPFISQWGPWTQSQVQQGSGQKYIDQAGKIQISPNQAQWYPNSPEYQGIRPAPPPTGQRPQPPPTGQQTQTIGGLNINQQNFVNPLTGAIGNPDNLNIQQWQVANQQFPQDPAQQPKTQNNVIYWPPPNTTLAPGQGNNGVTPWSTWTEVKQQGIVGGIMSQWQNWYQNPDVWAQWQEWMVLQQRKEGQYAK